MKTRRKVLPIVFITVVLLLVLFTIAFAYKTNTISSSNGQLHLYGYIDFLEGPGTIKDKIWYNSNLTGNQTYIDAIQTNGDHGAQNCCYILPGTNNGYTLNKIYMYKGHTVINGPSNGTYCGWGGTKGLLKMNVAGHQYSLYT